MESPKTILAIETSCDETALTLLRVENAGENPSFQVLSHIVLSQVDIHKEYGGVFPNLAKREHAKNLPALLAQTLKNADMHNEHSSSKPFPLPDLPLTTPHHAVQGKLETLLSREPEMLAALSQVFTEVKKPPIDYICVTNGPGLEPALWVGVNFARALNLAWGIPVVPVNHMDGHVVSVFASGDTFEVAPPQFPALALLISGGHTELVVMKSWGEYHKIGHTQDDAVGEAFDKVARLLGLEYPGGPKISRYAEAFRARANELEKKAAFDLFPRPMKGSGDFHFSFSGLKTAVRYYVEGYADKHGGIVDEKAKEMIAFAFEEAVTDVLLHKTKKAIQEHGIKTLIIAGGVAANKYIRVSFQALLADEYPDVELKIPDLALTGDNSLMIGVAGYFKIQGIEEGRSQLPDPESIRAEGNLSL